MSTKTNAAKAKKQCSYRLAPRDIARLKRYAKKEKITQTDALRLLIRGAPLG